MCRNYFPLSQTLISQHLLDYFLEATTVFKKSIILSEMFFFSNGCDAIFVFPDHSFLFRLQYASKDPVLSSFAEKKAAEN